MTSRSNKRIIGLLSLFALGFWTVGACTEEFPLEPGLLSVEVTFAASEAGQLTGTDTDRLAYIAGDSCSGGCPADQVCSPGGSCAHRMVFDVNAIGRDGKPFPYRGPVHLRATPGSIENTSDIIYMDKGIAEGVEVFVVRGHGKTHIWFEVDGYIPRKEDFGQCNDGIDNDGNGRIDLSDPGCTDESDDIEAPVSSATGVSPTLWFANPSIRDIQKNPLISTTALVGEQVTVNSGNLAVTNIVSNGFYAVDLNDNTPERGHAGIFVFTFSTPEGIRYKDRLCGISGSLQEFVGMTQLSFPSFVIYDAADPRCQNFPGLDLDAPFPEPWDVTDALLAEGFGNSEDQGAVYTNSLMLEALESNLVTFSNVAVSERFIACDGNGNGSIDSGTPEYGCRNECQDDPKCTDLESYFQFAQYAGVVDGKKKVYGSIALADQFTPLDILFIGDKDASGRCILTTTEAGFLEYQCTPTMIESLTGSLRHIYLCGATQSTDDESRCNLQFWVIDPRFDGDVIVAGSTEEATP